MSIRYFENETLFVLKTRHSCYQMTVDRTGCLRHLYYGPQVGDTNMGYRFRTCDRGFSGNPYEFAQDRSCSFDTMPQEYSGHGVGDFRISAIIAEAENGSQSTDLRFDSFEITEGKYMLETLPYVREAQSPVQTLIIRLLDPVINLAVELYYGVFEQMDIITRTARIMNASDRQIILKKAASLCLDLPGGLDLIHFPGRHCMERKTCRQMLSQDIVTVGSTRGMSSHHNNPFVILCGHHTDEAHGNAYGIMLMYSGNHKEEIEKDQTGSIRIVSGIHDKGFSWQLKPGAVFQTPEAILSFSQEGLNGLSRQFHRIIRENICDRKYLHQKKPVLLNSWEASYYDFDEESLFSLAVQAKELGIEMLVMDDGWFGSRTDDRQGLGDWFVNEERIRGGLKKLTDRINRIGLKFGLWLEPEMVSENSALYRAHPEWAMKDPDRPPMIARDQMVLDMSRADVRDYLFERITALLTQANIEYIKWDFNRSVANVYSNLLPASRQGEVMHRFVLGTYALLARIKKAFPQVLIEGCAGGGGRFDAGMLFFTPQIWCSDNTDPIARLDIQRGTSYGYPTGVMACHVSASPNHQTGRRTPLHTRGITALSGSLGYELDPSLLTEEEKQEIRRQIQYYHKYYWLIQTGDYYRLGDETLDQTCSCWEFAAKDRSEALVNVVFRNVEANPLFPVIYLQGLCEDAVYLLEGSEVKVSGAALMYGGWTLDCLFGDYPSASLHFVQCADTGQEPSKQ